MSCEAFETIPRDCDSIVSVVSHDGGTRTYSRRSTISLGVA